MPKVSIIIPVYKTEKYIHRCVDSVLAQTLSDIEVILVDDGSPDDCPEICDELAKKDSRIRVIHKPNGGLSSARNAGMNVAAGEYVGFVDSDDDVAPDMYEKLLNAAETYNADFVMADYIRVLPDGKSHSVSKNIRSGLYEKQDMVDEIFPELIMGENVDYGPILSVWQCLYKTDFLRKCLLSFADDVKWSEDNLFSALAGYNAKRFYYLKGEALYRYYQNPGTITTGYRPGAWDVYCLMNRKLREYFSQKTDYDFSRQLSLHILYYACNVIGMECRAADDKKDAIVRVKKILNDVLLTESMKKFRMPKVNFKLKTQIFLIRHRFAEPLVLIMRR